MARKLKTYQTSQGFYDLAIAAPSMKAALEAWGSDMNLFHKGFATETHDPFVVAATLKKPGVVLKRAVGSTEHFSENPHLPKDLPATGRSEPTRPGRKAKKAPTRKTRTKPDSKAVKKAALAYEKEERRHEAARRKEEAAQAKKRARRQQSMAKAEAALDDAQGEHDAIARRIEKEREAIDKRAEAEENRWRKLEERLAPCGARGD
jgi:hypothetical protein